MMRTIVKVAIAALALSYGQAYAFHSGGVAECGGCHQVHGSPSPNSLLVATDQSSTCLTCHEHAGDTGPSSYHISTAPADMGTNPPLQRTPGGDFGWLKRSYADAGIGYNEPGYMHGHNIVAFDKGYAADPVNATAPGGSMLAGSLGCQSCHDQHGQTRRFADGTYGLTGLPISNSGSYSNSAEPIAGNTAVGVYRLLRGSGNVYQGNTFTNRFDARVPSTYNRTEASSQTRVAYGYNSGQWCATCHPDMHLNDAFNHPVDQNLGTLSTNYTNYVSSGVLDATKAASSYNSLVPFNKGSGFDIVALKAVVGSLTGPDTTDQVSCMSCHRAHASGFAHAVRWQIENEFLTKAESLTGSPVFYCATDSSPNPSGRCALGRTTAEVKAAYYDRIPERLGSLSGTLGWQRSLCNKCHAKD